MQAPLGKLVTWQLGRSCQHWPAKVNTGCVKLCQDSRSTSVLTATNTQHWRGSAAGDRDNCQGPCQGPARLHGTLVSRVKVLLSRLHEASVEGHWDLDGA